MKGFIEVKVENIYSKEKGNELGVDKIFINISNILFFGDGFIELADVRVYVSERYIKIKQKIKEAQEQK